MRELAAGEADEPVEVTAPGGWGSWVNGGGRLTVNGWRVDWIYRDLDRVHRVWDDCRAGRYAVGFQVGHPLGFYSHAYAGEVALCRALAELQARTRGVACHALHGRARRWLINEKGMVASAARLPIAPPDFAERAHRLLGDIGQSPPQITQTTSHANALLAGVRAAVAHPPVQ